MACPEDVSPLCGDRLVGAKRPGLPRPVTWAQSQRVTSSSPSLRPFGDLPFTFSTVAGQAYVHNPERLLVLF